MIDELHVSREKVRSISVDDRFSPAQQKALQALESRLFIHPWELGEALARRSTEWHPSFSNTPKNQSIAKQLDYLYKVFRRQAHQ